MKERDIDALVTPWANARVAHFLSVYRAMTMKVDDEATETAISNGYNEIVFMRNMDTIDAFPPLFYPQKQKKPTWGNVLTS